MMQPQELEPRARNHYLEEDYFSLNVRNGVLRNPGGTRIVTLPSDFILGLHRGLEEETGAASALILHRCGRTWGERFFERHSAEMRAFYGMEAGDLPLAFFLQVLRRVWALHGWGRLELSFERREEGILEATVTSALMSDVIGNVGRTTDHLVAGILSAIASGLAGRELGCVETACRSRGDRRCAFLIAAPARIDIATQLVAKATSHADIVASLADGCVG